MAGILSTYAPVIQRMVGSVRGAPAIDVPPAEIHYIETNVNKRARCLKHLLKANHVNYAVLYNNLHFDNHNAHLLSSAYLLGASEAQLNHIYEGESKVLDPWKPSPQELIDEDWRDFLGDRRYQRAYVDYFEDKLAMEFAYDWKKELVHFLFSGKEPLFHGMISSLGHPLIQLGYAIEMDSREIAMEALALTCVTYDFNHKYLDDAGYTRPSPLSCESPRELLDKMSADPRLDKIKLPQGPNALEDLETTFEENESLLMEYWNGWKLDDPLKQFELSQEAAVDLLTATVRPGTHAFNFFHCHLLTTSHAVRVILSFCPPEHHISLVREWWLLVISTYLLKGRPKIDPDNVEKDLKGKGWAHVEDQAINSRWNTDAHYVKTIRAMRDAARTWGDVHERYLSAAVSFSNNFEGWSY